MAKLNLTAKTLAALKPAGTGRVDYFDTNLPGFLIRVTPAGVKTFGVMYRIGGHLRRYTIGTTDRTVHVCSAATRFQAHLTTLGE